MICIDEKICVGCKKCVEMIRDVLDCWGCCACVKICPKNAIAYKLSADLGGAGAKLFAEDSPTKLTWQISKSDGEKIFLEVDKTQANKF